MASTSGRSIDSNQAPGLEETLPEADALCVHHAFEAQARRVPDAVAVVCGERRITYGTLNQWANLCASRLRADGVRPEMLVGLSGMRTPELVAALMGILKAGGGYVPIDPNYPSERAAYMIESARVNLVLTTGTVPDHGWLTARRRLHLDSHWTESPDEGSSNVESGAREANIAAVIYTSGSTGLPKGVALSHGALLARMRNGQRPPGVSDLYLQRASISVVTHISEVLMPLVHGFTMVIVNEETVSHVVELAKALEQYGITRLAMVPAQLRAMLDDDAAVKSLGHLRSVAVSGDAVTPQLVSAFKARLPKAALVNAYGLTETAGLVSRAEITNPDAVRIGQPLPGAIMYVVDDELKPVPPGVSGELCVAGAQLARGYLHQPRMTAERFVPNPFTDHPGDRMYRTGDRAWRRSDGTLEFLGRVDHQVKIRGFRVELGEIESCLREYPGVRDAVVVTRDQPRGETRLVAYVVRTGPTGGNQLREHLERQLPRFMIPAAIVSLDELPKLPNGKVDRSALPAPPLSSSTSCTAADAPSTPVEEVLTQTWAEVLQLPRVGVNENFFDLGGDSLSAARLFDQIAKRFGVKWPLSSLFPHGTIREQARLLTEAPAADLWSPLVAIQPRGSNPPFFLVHGIGAEVLSFEALARHLGHGQPTYGLQADTRRGTAFFSSVEEVAATYLREVRRRVPSGPYLIGGYSSGGIIAYEMAQQVRAAGEQVAALIMLDSAVPGSGRSPLNVGGLWRVLVNTWFWLIDDDFFRSSLWDQVARVRAKLRATLARGTSTANVRDALGLWKMPEEARDYLDAHLRMIRAYRFRPYPGAVTVLRARTWWLSPHSASDLGWKALALGGVTVRQVPGAHDTILKEPRVRVLARALAAILREAG